MAKGKRQQRGSLFFDPLIQKYNGNIFKATDIEIHDKIPRLLKDIAFGNLDTNKYMQYFSPKLVYYLYLYAYNEFNSITAICLSLQESNINNPNDIIIENRRRDYSEKYKVYSIMVPLLYQFYLTGNMEILKVIGAKLKQTPVRSIFS